MYRYAKVCRFFEEAIAEGASAKHCSNLITGAVFSALATEEDKEQFSVSLSSKEFAKLVRLIDDGKINFTLAQMTLSRMLADGGNVDDYLTAADLAGVDDGELERLCAEAVANNPRAVADFKAGKEKAISALYGYIKRATQGKADIKKADEIIKKLIS